MKITHKEMITSETEVLDGISCNKCGESCRDDCDMNWEGLVEATICGGYGSKLGDGVEYTFSLCEECLKKLFSEFKHQPEKCEREKW